MTELEFLQQQHGKGRIGRREFIGRAAALGAGAALISTMVGEVEARAAETPAKGGTLRLGLGGGSTTDSIDPGSYYDSVMVDVGHAVFNGLVEWAQDGKAVPELAESWEAKPDASEWVFNLRKGVTFGNGKTFDADDAIYSLNMHRGNTKSGAAGAFKEVSDIKKLNANQIQVSLASPDSDFPDVLTDYHVLVVPNEYKDWSTAVGTGGYVMERYDPGVRISVKRNPNYWKPDRAHVDAVDFTVINDSAARMSAMVSGQVDAINRVDTKTVALISKSGKVEIVRAPGGWHTLISMMEDRAPFDNVDLRLALKYAIDRQQILKTLFQGYGTVGDDQPIPRSDPFYNPELPQLSFDPDKAKFHYRKSGLENPHILVQASEAAFNGAVNMATLFQASANKCGIKIDVKNEPADGFWANVWLKGSCVTSYWAGRAGATQMLAIAYGPDAPWNEGHYKDPHFTELLDKARGELDEAKRKPYIWEMQAMLATSGTAIIPAFRDWLDAHSPKIGGHTPHPGFDMDNGYIAEKAWIKA